MNVLAVDVGGTHVKFLATGQKNHRQFASGPALTAKQMATRVRYATRDWTYDVVSIGYPGPVLHGRPIAEPHNLGRGWVGFSFEKAFRRPVKVINDAAMQALGSYQRGKMLFLGLGTGLGSALIVNGEVEPMDSVTLIGMPAKIASSMAGRPSLVPGILMKRFGRAARLKRFFASRRVLAVS